MRLFKFILLAITTFSLSTVNFAQPIEQKMNELVSAYAKQNNFNGVVLVAQNGNILFSKGYGLRNAEEKQWHETSDIFQIGSITKQITAAVIMQLHDEGKLSVKDKLSKFFAGFANGDKITIEHLLTHTSGIYNYTNDTAILNSDVTKPYSSGQMIDVFRKYKPDFEPGEKFNYSNSGYSLLGYIIEQVTRKPYEAVVREKIFYPLGMMNSGFDFTRLNHISKSKGYFQLKENEIKAAPIVDSTIAYSAGSIYSTVDDLLKWERAVSEKKLLKPESWQAVFTPYKSKYGYGWGIDSVYGKPFMAHSGGIHGFSSYLVRFPNEGLVVIALDNASSNQLNSLSKSLAAIVLNQPYNIPGVKKEIQLPAEVLKQYEGEYQFSPSFSITVSMDGKVLKAQATGQPSFELFAEAENKFFLKVVDAQLEFIRNSDGKVTELVLYQNGAQPKGKKIK
jgi:CubicO group peptidase (beta-lactamase class C family)